MLLRLMIITFMLSLISCASTVPKALDRLQVGMDKDDVLRLAGNPKRTFRSQGQDHWIYTYYIDDQEWRRDVVFESQRVIRVTRATPTAKEKRGLEDAETMEEFESKARSRQKASDFQYIDGGPAED